MFNYRNLQGENYVVLNEEAEPKNLACGVYEGLKGILFLMKVLLKKFGVVYQD
jgi:hypothetical protein